MNNQTNGDGSIQTKNITAKGNIHLTTGVTYTEVEKIVLNLFDANFPKLLAESYEKANENIKLSLEILKSKMEVAELRLDKIKLTHPDTHYVFNDAITMIGRKGEKIDSELICDILVEKISENKDEYEMLIDEALNIVPRLNKTHLDFLSTMAMLYEYSFQGMEDPLELEAYNKLTFSKLYNSFEIPFTTLAYLSTLGVITLRPYRVRHVNTKVSNEIIRNNLYRETLQKRNKVDIEKEKERMPFTFNLYTNIGKKIDVELYELTLLGELIATSHFRNLMKDVNTVNGIGIFDGILELFKTKF